MEEVKIESNRETHVMTMQGFHRCGYTTTSHDLSLVILLSLQHPLCLISSWKFKFLATFSSNNTLKIKAVYYYQPPAQTTMDYNIAKISNRSKVCICIVSSYFIRLSVLIKLTEPMSKHKSNSIKTWEKRRMRFIDPTDDIKPSKPRNLEKWNLVLQVENKITFRHLQIWYHGSECFAIK